jgi:hypothetical protein
MEPMYYIGLQTWKVSYCLKDSSGRMDSGLLSCNTGICS